jgi:energy-coupling factor transporter ATP-binding protein EcfA2
LTLGWHYPDMVDVLSTAVYATDDGVFLRLNDRERVSPSMFAASVQNIVKRNPRDQLLASSALVRVRKVDYLAGDDRLVVDGVANQWVRDGVLPAEGDCSVILDFLKYLIPIEREREYILDYLAHMVQKPSVKIAHGLMLTGLQGNGKSTFARILKRMLGRNARTVNGAELHGRFKNRFVDCQLLHIEEAHHGGRLEAYEQHKQLMTDEHFAVEEKNVPRWDGRTPRGVVMCTNDESGVVIPQGDRRWFIASTVDEKRDSRYFRELNEAIDDDAVIAAFAHQSEGRDIARFYPGAEPPMTEAKLRAMEATSTPLAQVLRMIRDEGVQPWTRKTFATMEDIMSSLRGVAFEVGALTPNKVAKALKDIGALQLKRLRLGGTRVRLWALDGDRKWASASEDEIRDRFEIDGAASLQGLGVSSLPSAIQEAIRAASRGVEA